MIYSLIQIIIKKPTCYSISDIFSLDSRETTPLQTNNHLRYG